MLRLTKTRIATAALALLFCAVPVLAVESTVITFDYDQGGFDFSPDCTTIVTEADESYLNFSNVCDDHGNLRGWFNFWNETDGAWIGDYTAKGEVRISLDLDVEFYDFYNRGKVIEADEYRELVVEFVDYNNPAPDYAYTSVWFNAGTLPARADGWKHFTIDMVDVDSAELPEGWDGYGAEDPETYEPMLPEHRTYSDVLAGVDEVRFTTLVPGLDYSLNFLHSINVDNITIEALPQYCNGLQATVFVEDGRVVGGPLDGHAYSGVLAGTEGDDVIIGTERHDAITGFAGNDTICGRGREDVIHGAWGDDLLFGEGGNDILFGGPGDDRIDAGEGDDQIHGGLGSDVCENGETTYFCNPTGPSDNTGTVRSLIEQKSSIEFGDPW